MKINRWLMVAGMAAAMFLGGTQGFAQNDQGGGGQGGRGGRGGGNFDPAQFRERMMERTKETLEITDDAEWKAVQPLVEKVMDARMSGMGGMGRGMMFGGPPRRNGDNGGGQGAAPRRGQFGPPASAESEALQRAIDGKASNSEMKAAIAKYAEARKAKQAELEKAQAELRKVLSVRQEAIATLNGLL